MKPTTFHICCLLLLMYTCGNKSSTDYYFPAAKFTSTRIYTFVNQKDTAEKSIWELSGSIKGSDTLLTTSIFDTYNRITEVIHEKISGGNANLIGYTLYSYDPEGKQYKSECVVVEDKMFKGNQQGGDTIRWKVRFKDPANQVCEMSKTRTVNLKTQKKKIFNDEFQLTIPEKSFTGKYGMVSTYAPDTGVVAFTINLPGGVVKEFKLASLSDRK